MSKNKKFNAFFLYTLDFRKKREREGFVYPSFAEALKDAGQLWPSEPEELKARFKILAQKKNDKYTSKPLYTSTGVQLSEIQRREKELQRAMDLQRQTIKDMIRDKHSSGTLLKEKFYLIDVTWCERDTIILEFSLLKFSIEEGILDVYHKIVKPFYSSYHGDLKYALEKHAMTLPPDMTEMSNFKAIRIKLHHFMAALDPPPIMFTTPGKMRAAMSFLSQLCKRNGEDETKFRVYQLDSLAFDLIDNLKSPRDEGLAREQVILRELENQTFYSYGGLACHHHLNVDRAAVCTSSRVKGWAFTILELCLLLLKIPIKMGRHLPVGYDLEHLSNERNKAMVGLNMKSYEDVLVNSITNLKS